MIPSWLKYSKICKITFYAFFSTKKTLICFFLSLDFSCSLCGIGNAYLYSWILSKPSKNKQAHTLQVTNAKAQSLS